MVSLSSLNHNFSSQLCEAYDIASCYTGMQHVTDDDELNYHNLNPLVQNGGHAMTIFPQIKDMEPEKAAEAREALLAYCHLDTLAMVRVWEKLKKIV